MTDQLVQDMLSSQLALVQPTLVEVKKIYLDHEWNSRGEFSIASIVDLAESIKKTGLRDAILVRTTNKYPGYEYAVVYGHRRLEAHKYLGRELIPAKVTTLPETDALVLNIVENLERVDVNFYQQSTGVWRLQDLGYTVDMLKHRLNQSTTWVNRRIGLRTLPDQCHRLAAMGVFKPTHVDKIGRIPNLAGKMKFLRMLQDTSKKIETGQALVDTIKKIEDKSTARKEQPRSKAEVSEMQKRVQSVFGVADNEAKVLAWVGGYWSDDDYYTHLEERAKEEGKFFRRPEVITLAAIA